jgi:hypothetical protein
MAQTETGKKTNFELIRFYCINNKINTLEMQQRPNIWEKQYQIKFELIWNEEKIQFRECLLSFISESCVFLSPSKVIKIYKSIILLGNTD